MVGIVFASLAGVRATNTNYYIASTGSDSNSGTSQGSPWLHAPGMQACTANCAAATIGAGDRIIFRGGDVWHMMNSALAPYMGHSSGSIVWNISYGGTSANCQLVPELGTTVNTSCAGITTDHTFFNSTACGASFCRPVFTMDNPISTTQPATCTFDVDAINGIHLNNPYFFINDIEFEGNCSGSSPNGGFIGIGATQVQVTNSYFHGWTFAKSATGDDYWEVGAFGSSGLLGANYADHNVFDNSDGTFGTTAFHAVGKVFAGVQYVAYNVIRHASNIYVGGTGSGTTFHDNLLEFDYNTNGISNHANIWEANGTGAGSQRIYNNMYRHSDEGLGIFCEAHPGASCYIFNNVIYDTANSSDCLLTGLPQTGNTAITGFTTNNTFDSQANVQGQTNGGCQEKLTTGTNTTTPNTGNLETFANNHFVNYSPQALTSFYFYAGGVNSSEFPITDTPASEIFQSESVANAQGYQASNSYAPTMPTNATIGTGSNLTSQCASFSYDSALCSGTSGGVLEVSGEGGFVVSYPAIPIVTRPTTGPWNTGAYQLAGVNLSPASQNFGSVNVGFTGTPTTFTLTNSSGATVTGISVGFVGGNSGDWTNTGSGTCTSTLANSASCTIIVEFVPTVTGARSTTLTVTDSAINSPQTSALTGTGSTAGSVTVSPTSNNFGSVTVGSTSAAATFTLSNTTGVSLTGITVTFIGTNASDFAQSGGSCGSTLTSGSTCTILATFTPGATGARSGALNIADSDPSSPQTSTFIGTGVSAGSVTLTPATQNFGSINLGSSSVPITFTLSNTMPSGLTGIAITLTGTNSADFAQTGGTCSTTLGASSTCTIILTFTPAAAGTRTATLNVADSATSSPQQSALVGNGNTITPLPGPCPVCFE